MSESVWGWIFFAGVAQGAFLMTALASLKARNSRARWLLAACIGVFTLMLGEEFLDVTGSPLGIGLGLMAEFAVGPLLLLFVDSLAGDDLTPTKRKWMHFLPLAAAAIWLAFLNLGFESRWVSLSNPEVRNLVAGTVFTKIAYFSAYAFVILRRRWALGTRPEPLRRALTWVRAFLWLFCAIYAAVAISFILFYLRPSLAIDSDLVGGLSLALSIFALGYFTIFNRNVFDVRAARVAYKGEEDRKFAEKAAEYLKVSRAFTDPDLELADVAASLAVSETRLSRALNAGFSGGFYALINDLRLSAFRDSCAQQDADDKNVLELALEAGFGSKATFYRFFKLREGTTPTAYRDRIRQERLTGRSRTQSGRTGAAAK